MGRYGEIGGDCTSSSSSTPCTRRAETSAVSRQDRISRLYLVDALYEARCALHVAAEAPLAELLSPLLDGGGADTMMAGAEVAVDDAGAASLPFSVAPVGGRYSVDGELASFFTAKDEAFMLRRTLSRLTEMCGPQAEY